MIEVSKRRLLVDGRPRIVLAGELHYFRVPRAEWEQRLGRPGALRTACRGRSRGGVGWQPPHPPHGSWAHRRPRLRSVSYTHLTLPTNREV